MDPKQCYEEIVDDLVHQNDDVEPAQMMGMPCVKRGGKMVAGFSRSDSAMTFKLTDEREREGALALEGAHLFDPSGKGRPFKEWVVVPLAHADEWPQLAQQALAH
ncbi:MAG: hypothetical protein M3R70_02285 [Actinomycetota bacterium]|nr:hypothetical protein [Actinomycetota bacterium]